MSWSKANNRLKRVFSFDDYDETMAFVNEVARLADDHNHHPTMTVGYDEVVVELTTHDAGNRITEKDRELAEAVDELVK